MQITIFYNTFIKKQFVLYFSFLKDQYMRCRLGLLLSMLLFTCYASQAQQGEKRFKIAVFAPIYLDSAFNGDTYKLGAGNIPKNILPGLEFYNGVMVAIDSLQADKAPVDVLIYDSKGKETFEQITAKPEFKDVGLIIASFNSRQDVKALSDLALDKNIPLISAVYPNDGGTTNNPFFVMINTSLKTHCEELYKYMQRYYSLNNIIYIRRKGALEDLVQSYFNDQARSTASLPLKIKTIELSDSFTNKQLLSYLDSTKQNVVLCGTLNELFGVRMARTISAAPNYKTTIIGMPTWDGLKDLDRQDCKGVEFIYSTPYNFTRLQPMVISFTQRYRVKFSGRPSDIAFKGFESMYHFSKLLVKHGNDLINNLSDKDFKIFNDFDIQPVRNKTNRVMVDYLENRKLYFIKKQDGQVK